MYGKVLQATARRLVSMRRYTPYLPTTHYGTQTLTLLAQGVALNTTQGVLAGQLLITTREIQSTRGISTQKTTLTHFLCPELITARHIDTKPILAIQLDALITLRVDILKPFFTKPPISLSREFHCRTP